jgi:hypothetical protein
VLARERSYFGNFDPFGDFDLIFGAAKQNLKIDPLQGTHLRRNPKYPVFATDGCC